MTPHERDTGAWSITRWSVAIAIALALHFGAAGLRRPGSVAAPQPEFPSRQVLILGPQAPEEFTSPQPALFALFHPNGFSGPAWASSRSFEVPEAPSLPPPLWFPPPSDQLASTFASRVKQQAGPGFSRMSQPRIEIDANDVASPLPEIPVLRLHGRLVDRPVLRWPDNPTRSGPSTRSVIEIGVASDGFVQSRRLLRRTPSTQETDQAALAAARQLRFAPEPSQAPTGLMFGTLEIIWPPNPPPSSTQEDRRP